MTEKSEDQVIWVVSNWSTGEKLLQTNNYQDVHKFMCEEGKDKSIKGDRYIHDSKYLSIKSDLAVAVEALEEITESDEDGEILYCPRDMRLIAKEALGKIGGGK